MTDEVRYAGWVGDAEFAVRTVQGGDRPDQHNHCTKPCPQCPWRRDVPTGVFPAEAFRISAPTAYDMATRVFACHMAAVDSPRTCAGFLLRGALHSLTIRLALMQRRLDPRRVSDGGFPLYRSYREMAEANGVAADDPVLGPCRSGYD